MSTAARRWLRAALQGLLLLYLALPARAELEGADALRLQTGEVWEAGGEYPTELPPAQAAWQTVTLPDNWDGQRSHYTGYAWYRFRLQGISPARRLAVYLPNAGMNAELVVNGVRLGSHGRMQMPATRHFYTPLFFELPRAALRNDGQADELLVLLVGHPGYRCGLGPPFVGEYSALYHAWRWRGFWQNTGTLVSCVLSMVIGVYALFLWWGERQQSALGWFGVALLVWGLRNLNLVLTEPPFDDLLWAQVTVAGAAAFTGLFSIFATRLAEQEDSRYRSPRWFVPAVLGYIGVAFAFFMTQPGYQQSYAGFVPLSLVGMGLTLWSLWRLLRLAWVRRTATLVAVAAAAAVYTVLLIADFRMASDSVTLGTYYKRQYASVPLFVAIALLLARQYFAALARSRELSARLQSEVEAQRQVLQRSFEQLRQAERQQALVQERERLTRDLHDSLGMHLVAALRQVRQSAPAGDTLAATLQDCLDDLRVVIDSLGTEERDPVVALGTLRFRLAPRFEALGVRLEWHLQGPQTDWPALQPAVTLELLRIVQEALTNALKHSGAQVVRLGLEGSEQALRVTVTDNGRGLGAAHRAGHGLPNMRARAARIGADWALQSSEQGCTVMLVLPWPGPGAGPGAELA